MGKIYIEQAKIFAPPTFHLGERIFQPNDRDNRMVKAARLLPVRVHPMVGVVSRILCKFVYSQFLKEWQIVTHLSYRV